MTQAATQAATQAPTQVATQVVTQLTTLATTPGVESQRTASDALRWRRTPGAAFVVHPRWLAAVRDHLVPGAEPEAELSLDGVAAMRAALVRRTAAMTLGLPRHDHLSLTDLIARDDLAPRDTGRALDALLAEHPGLFAFEASRVPDDSVLMHAVRADTASLRWHARAVSASAWFDLDAASDALPVPGKLRRNLTRLARGLHERGRLETSLVGPEEPAALHAAFDAFLALEASGWKGQRASAIRGDAALEPFYRALLTNAGDGLAPRIAVLTLDDRPIAAQLALACGDTLNLLKIAYDESEARSSPGSQLLLATLGAARDEGLTRVSLVTAPDWAERWHPQQAPVWHVVRYEPGTGGRALRRWHALRESAARTSRVVRHRTRRQPDTERIAS